MDKKDFSGKIGFGKTNLFAKYLTIKVLGILLLFGTVCAKVINVIFFIQIKEDSKTGKNIVSVFIRKTFNVP